MNEMVHNEDMIGSTQQQSCTINAYLFLIHFAHVHVALSNNKNMIFKFKTCILRQQKVDLKTFI